MGQHDSSAPRRIGTGGKGVVRPEIGTGGGRPHRGGTPLVRTTSCLRVETGFSRNAEHLRKRGPPGGIKIRRAHQPRLLQHQLVQRVNLDKYGTSSADRAGSSGWRPPAYCRRDPDHPRGRPPRWGTPLWRLGLLPLVRTRFWTNAHRRRQRRTDGEWYDGLGRSEGGQDESAAAVLLRALTAFVLQRSQGGVSSEHSNAAAHPVRATRGMLVRGAGTAPCWPSVARRRQRGTPSIVA